MLGGAGMEADIVEAPVIPLFACEDRFGVAECRTRLRTFVALGVIVAEVDQRIGLGLSDVVHAGNLGALLVISNRLIKVPQLAVNPANRVGHSPENDVV